MPWDVGLGVQEADVLACASFFPFCTFVYVYWIPAPDRCFDRVRYAGTALQLLGLSTVWLGIEQTRKRFGFEYTPVAIWRWLKSAPWTEAHRNVTASLQGTMAAFTGGGVGTITDSTPDTSPEGRLRALEQRVAGLETRFTEEIGRLGHQVDAISRTTSVRFKRRESK